MHGSNANVPEEGVSRHIMAEDLHGVMVTLAYLHALHLEAREMTGKAAQALLQGAQQLASQHNTTHATPKLSIRGSIDIHTCTVFS